MEVIYKYTITELVCELSLAKGAKIRNVHIQGNKLCLWAQVKLDEPSFETVTIVVHPTGGEVRRNDYYIGTAHSDKGLWAGAWHVYKRETK